MKLFLICSAFISLIAQQQVTSDFLYLESGARSSASGQAFFVGQGDISAYRYFPADYTFNSKRKVFGTFVSKYDGLVQQFSAGYSQPLFGGLNLTANYNYSGVSDIPRFEELNPDGGTFEPDQKSPSGYFGNSNHIFSATFGKIFDEVIDVGWNYFTIPIRIPTAVQVNYLRSTLDEYSANAFTVDVSAGLQFNLGDLIIQRKGIGDLIVYFNAMNVVGSNLAWDQVSSLDGSSKTTTSEEIASNFTFGTNLITEMEELSLKFGVSYQYQDRYAENNFGMMFIYDELVELRFGINEDLFTIGGGVHYFGTSLFLSLKPKHELGKEILVDLSYDF